LFGTSVAFGFIAWGIVAAQYFWPLLRAQARVDALRRLLLLHSFRFVGLAIVKGVVAPELPAAFAYQSHTAISLPRCWPCLCWLLCTARSASPWSGYSTFGAVRWARVVMRYVWFLRRPRPSRWGSYEGGQSKLTLLLAATVDGSHCWSGKKEEEHPSQFSVLFSAASFVGVFFFLQRQFASCIGGDSSSACVGITNRPRPLP
jgi:hypothetical protein